jgi:hypothetical protein
MEERKNLYLFDDFCIILSYILMALLLIELRPLWSLVAENRSDLLLSTGLALVTESPLKLGGLFFSAFFLQVLGRGVRKKEKEFLAVINALNHSGRYSLQALAFELGVTEKKLNRTLDGLTALPRSGISFDGNYVKKEREKVDPGLSAARFRRDPAVSFPGKTGSESRRAEAGTGMASPLDPEPRDALSGSPISTGSGRGTPVNRAAPGKTGQAAPFNIAVFLVLFFVFWPAAFIYAARGALRNSQQKALGK